MVGPHGDGTAGKDTCNRDYQSKLAEDVPIWEGQPTRSADSEERTFQSRETTRNGKEVREGAKSQEVSGLHREGP